MVEALQKCASQWDQALPAPMKVRQDDEDVDMDVPPVPDAPTGGRGRTRVTKAKNTFKTYAGVNRGHLVQKSLKVKINFEIQPS